MPEMLQYRGATTTETPSGGVRLSERQEVGKLDLRGEPNDKAFMSAVGRVLDLLLPTEPCNSAAQGEIVALWLGPNQWLIACPKAACAGLAVRLEEALSGIHGAVTDISAGRTVFRLAGPSAIDVIAKGCPLDLHPRAAGKGYVAGSVLAKISALIHLRDGDIIDIYLGRSYADYLWAWLKEAGSDCGLVIA
jgi:sarcosine oxidase subunit gamma